MAGFKVRRVYKLTFEEPEFEGMEVRAHGLPLGELFHIMGLSDGDGELDLEAVKGLLGSGDLATIRQVLKLFGDRLVGWNLVEDDESPISADFDGLMSLDMDVAIRLFMAWLKAVSSVSAPLDEPSADGRNSEEALIPMEPLSESLAS